MKEGPVQNSFLVVHQYQAEEIVGPSALFGLCDHNYVPLFGDPRTVSKDWVMSWTSSILQRPFHFVRSHTHMIR